MTQLRIAILILAVLARNGLCTDEIKMVIRVARHGARGPMKDSEFGLEWKGFEAGYDFGELIPAGYRQHYLSGIELTLKYRNLFLNKLEPEEYYLRSTEKDRAYHSLFAHFLAFNSTVYPQGQG